MTRPKPEILGAIQEKIRECNLCPLRQGCRRPVPFNGNLDNPLALFVGEAPGELEDKKNKPFVGKSGKELHNYLSMYGINWRNCLFDNVVKCRPPNNRTPVYEEYSVCSRHLIQLIDVLQPRLIVACGSIATNLLVKDSIGVDALHGIPQRGEAFSEIILPTYHPAAGLHNTRNMVFLLDDFKKVAGCVRREISVKEPDRSPVDYRELIDEDRDYLQNLLEGAERIAIDTETLTIPDRCPVQEPICLTFSVKPGQAFLVHAESRDCLRIIDNHIAHGLEVVLHNAAFDIPMLEKMGITIDVFFDSMIAAYLLQDLPQGLKPLAYRLCNMEMESYRSVIKDKANRRIIAYLIDILTREWEEPEPRLVRCAPAEKEKTGKEFKLYKPQGIHRRIKSIINKAVKEKTGNGRIDSFAVWEKDKKEKDKHVLYLKWIENCVKPATENGLFDRLEFDLFESWLNIDFDERDKIQKQLGWLFPPNLTDVPDEDCIHYACRDADATLRIYTPLRERIRKMQLEEVMRMDSELVPLVCHMEKAGIQLDMSRFKSLSLYYEREIDKINNQLQELVGEFVNPNSHDQVRQLLFGKLGLKESKGKKALTDSGELSTAEAILESMKEQHEAIPLIIQSRKLSKNKNSFADTLPCFRDGNDRVHPHIRMTRTVTGRFAVQDPPLQCIPVRTEEGKKIRSCFRAKKGCVLVAGDYSQLELRMLAEETLDPVMLKIFNEGQDIHKITASKMFGIAVDRLDPLKHRYPAKRINFGILYGLSAEGLHDQLVLAGITGETVKSCREMINEWFAVFANVKPYFRRAIEEAKRFGYVRDWAGRIRRIPEMRSCLPFITREGERYACSMKIQGGASEVMKIAMLKMAGICAGFRQQGFLARPLLQIHDDCVYEVDEDIAYDFAAQNKKTMENCCPHFVVPLKADQKVGEYWGEMDDLVLK